MLFPFFAFPRHIAGSRLQIVKSPFPTAASFLRHTNSTSRLSIRHVMQMSIKEPSIPRFFMMASIGGVGLGIALLNPHIHCDAPTPLNPSNQSRELPPPPTTTVSYYELSFGTITGVCAGVFIKKGAKVVAWFLGGIFVLLQYLGSQSLVHVDWGRMATRFERMFYTTDTTGVSRKPTVGSLWSWMVDFLTADFQPRASFIAGLVLGLRIG